MSERICKRPLACPGEVLYLLLGQRARGHHGVLCRGRRTAAARCEDLRRYDREGGVDCRYLEASSGQEDVKSGADPRIISTGALEGIVAQKDLKGTRFVGLEPGSPQVCVDEIHMTAGADESTSVGDQVLCLWAHVEEDVANHDRVPDALVQAARRPPPVDDASIRHTSVGDGLDRCGTGRRVRLDTNNLATLAGDSCELDQHRSGATTHVDDPGAGDDPRSSHEVPLTLHRKLGHPLEATLFLLGELQRVVGRFLTLVRHGCCLL
jgi:hypothetical protein